MKRWNRTFRLCRPRPRLLAVGLVSFIYAHALGGAAEPLKSAREIKAALLDPRNVGRSFDLTGEVVEYARGRSNEWNVVVQAEGVDLLVKDMSYAPSTGAKAGPDDYAYLDRVRFRGRIFEGELPNDKRHLGSLHGERLSSGNTDQVPEIPLQEVSERRSLGHLVHVCGIVRSAARDEADPNFVHLMLRGDSSVAHVFVHITASTPFDPTQYLGAEVRTCGICRNYNNIDPRRHIGHVLAVSGLENVHVTKPPMSFDTAPDIEMLNNTTPQQIAGSGLVRVHGAVLAAWGKNSILLKAPGSRLVRVHLQRTSLPAFGEQIVALGLPITDFYSIDLIHARWQPTGLPRMKPEIATASSPRNMQTQYKGKSKLMVHQRGKAVKFTGVVRYLPEPDSRESVLQLESDGFLTPVDISATPQILDKLQIGYVVSISGVCIFNVDNWNSEAMQDISQRFFLVPRTLDDVVVLSRPPWWTPRRLLVLLGMVAIALLVVIAWNVSLNRRAKAKGMLLAKEQIAHVASELKVRERTRLAIELHDMMSQMLSGISMQIGTVRKFFDVNREKTLHHLDIAARTLLACRESLRDCLWDLRNHAIEEPDMSKAIRDTLKPHVDDDTPILIRFNVPRDRLSDNAAHAILSIIRELVVNALRHGAAKSVKVAGSVENGKVLFSVADDGAGFDPSTAPGMAQGHFGLQGIRERVDGFEGEMTVTSSAGRGTKVTIALNLPAEDTADTNHEND